MTKNKRILLVEDDHTMGFLLKDSLMNYSYEVTHVTNGQLGLNEFMKSTFDVCILDVMLPVLDGFSLATAIRKHDVSIPILFLTARSLKEDRIKGFKIGGDDYITKPFSVEELALRIQAILRRGNSVQLTAKQIPFAGYTLNIDNLILSHSSDTYQLTQKEADILELLVSHPNLLLKREFILKTIWKDDSYFVGRSLDVFISKLRKYLKNDPLVNIVNIHGTGYKMEIKG